MELIYGFIGGIIFSAFVAVHCYTVYRVRKLEKRHAATENFQPQVEMILKEIKAYENHVTELSKVITNNNEFIISKIKQHESLLTDQHADMNAIATSLKKLSDYVANNDK
jgi:hypothetical protein